MEYEEDDIREEVTKTVKEYLKEASNHDTIFKQYKVSEKRKEKEMFLSHEIFKNRQDIDKPFVIYVEDKIDVIVVPVGSAVEGTNVSVKKDYDFLVILDIKSGHDLNICSTNDENQNFLQLSNKSMVFPKFMQKRMFESLHTVFLNNQKKTTLMSVICKMLSFIFRPPPEGTKEKGPATRLTGKGQLSPVVNTREPSLLKRVKKFFAGTKEKGPATRLTFTIGSREEKVITIDLVPCVLVYDTEFPLKSGLVTDKILLQKALEGIGSFFVVQMRESLEYRKSFNLSELKLMGQLKTNGNAAYDAYLFLKKLKRSRFFCVGESCKYEKGDKINQVVTSYVLKTLVLALAADESCNKMTQSEIVDKVLEQLRDSINYEKKHLPHLWCPEHNLLDFGSKNRKSLDHAVRHIQDILRIKKEWYLTSKL